MRSINLLTAFPITSINTNGGYEENLDISKAKNEH
jgi:hypothetical protein